MALNERGSLTDTVVGMVTLVTQEQNKNSMRRQVTMGIRWLLYLHASSTSPQEGQQDKREQEENKGGHSLRG